MTTLNFPAAQFRVKNTEKGRLIFDEIRKKFVVLTPEEWVRQHVIKWLLQVKNIPASLINVEKQLIIAGTKKRYDLLVYNTQGNIALIVECKAPEVSIKQEVFDQIARYNLVLDATYLMVTNGLNHYYCNLDYDQQRYNFIQDIPVYPLNFWYAGRNRYFKLEWPKAIRKVPAFCYGTFYRSYRVCGR